MGTAEVLPGVSGGTIAFITGIYEELLETIKGFFNLDHLKLLLRGKFLEFAKATNLVFLIVLFSGMLLAVALMLEQIHFLLDHYPIGLWSFFCGLTLASAVIIRKQIARWDIANVSALIGGTAIALFVATRGVSASGEMNLIYIFFCGAIAICALILPGISGSLILLILGAYQLVTSSAKDVIHAMLGSPVDDLGLKVQILTAFLLGIFIGLLTFVRFVSWLFKHYRQTLTGGLMGFLIGSLWAVWPWKQMVETGISDKVIYMSVSPSDYTAGEPQFAVAAIFLLVGFSLVYFLEKFGQKD